MSEDDPNSVTITPGKLQDLKRMFEKKNHALSPETPTTGSSPPKAVSGRGRPVLPPTPPKPVPVPGNSHPKPAPRQASPGKKGVTIVDAAGTSPSAGEDSQETAFSYGTVPRPRRRTSSKGQDWSSTLERKKKMSPTVSRRIAMFNDEENATVITDDGVNENQVTERKFLSPVARSGHPKRLSDPCTDKEGSPDRKTVAERRKTMDNFPFDANADSESKEVKVQNQIKKFQEKPSLPKKPVVTNAAQPLPPKTAEKTNEVASDTYEVPWDIKPGKNVERLNAMGGDQQSHQKPSLPDAQKPAGKHKAGVSKPTAPRPKANASKQKARPTEQPPPPPSKPPRTFVHSEYLESKVQAAEGQNTQETKVKFDEEDVSIPSVKDKMSAVEDTKDSQPVTMRAVGNARLSPKPQEGKESKGVREKPPKRPPPPRPRPVSEVSTLNRRHALQKRTKPANDSDNEGPVVISLKTGRPISRQVSMSSTHRKPHDRLPERPEGEGSLQRFPLRKSFSSECLFKGSVSSISDPAEEEEFMPASMLQSCHAGNYEEPIYEALIDTDGYAVPNQFLRRLPQGQAPQEQQAASNKTGFLKRLLAPSPSGGCQPSGPTTTPIKDQDVEKVPAKKMNLVKQKINQAYEALHVVFGRTSVSEEGEIDGQDPSTRSDDPDSTDTDSIVDVKEIRQRVTYCSTVRLKTLQSVKKAREFMDRIYPQLFEYALIVGLSPKVDDPGYEPVILHKFPQTVESNMSVPQFCFPDADQFRPGSMTSTSESYSFVLTHTDGSRMYGYCRRIQPRDSSLPEVICIISPVDAFNMYNKLLTEIETRRFKSFDNAQEMLAASFGRPMPKPGKVCHIRALDEHGDMETMFLERPSDQHLANVNYESLLMYLGTDKLIQVFASMLIERRLILCSRQLSALTQTIHALVALLYPFHWQHVYIPLLPAHMLEVCASPTPFIIGILRSHLPQVTALDLEDVIIVDLDNKQVLRSVGDEMNLIPRKVQKALKTAINMCKIDSDALHSQWLMVSEAFLRLFLETMGHFSQHIFTQQDGTKTLMKEQFIAGGPSKGIRQFLEWFTETQMFEVFITMHVEKQHWGSMDLFMSRLGELQKKSQTEGSAVRGIGQKVKNLGKALKTKWKDTT